MVINVWSFYDHHDFFFCCFCFLYNSVETTKKSIKCTIIVETLDFLDEETFNQKNIKFKSNNLYYNKFHEDHFEH